MSSILILLAVLVLNITLWIILFIRLRKEFSPDAVLYSIRDEVDKLIIEINRVADRDITLIEARRNGLKQLLDEIDKKLSLHESLLKSKDDERKILKRLTKEESKNEPAIDSGSFNNQVPDTLFGGSQETQSSGFPPVQLTMPSDNAENIERSPLLPVHPVSRAASVYKRNEIPELNTEPIEKMDKKEEPIHITFSSDPISPKQDKRRSVLKMAGEGFTAEIIAEKLKIPVREVSLIMDLYS